MGQSSSTDTRVECLTPHSIPVDETLGDKLEVRKFGEVMGEKRKIKRKVLLPLI